MTDEEMLTTSVDAPPWQEPWWHKLRYYWPHYYYWRAVFRLRRWRRRYAPVLRRIHHPEG